MKKLIILLVFLTGVFAQAQTTWVVDSLNDSGFGSLRAAADSCAAGDTIRFNPNLLANGSDSIVLTSGEITVVNKGVVIIGLHNSSDTLFISGGQSSRILSFTLSGIIVLDSMTLINGNGVSGGAIYVDLSDTLFIRNSKISNNVATIGGGVYCTGYGSLLSRLVIDNSLIKKNTASHGGGIRGVDVLVSNSEINDNIANGFGGGGIEAKGNVRVTNSNISGNTSAYSRGGGGIYGTSRNSIIVIENSSMSGNFSNTRGGAICVLASTNHVSTSQITIRNSTLSGNTSNHAGGAIFSQTSTGTLYPSSSAGIVIDNSTISGNLSVDSTFGAGGAMSVQSSNLDINIKNSTITGNNAFQFGSGISAHGAFTSNIIIKGSIVAENGVGSSGFYNTATNTITSHGYNVFSDSPIGYSGTDSVNVSASQLNLLTLNLNGGTTKTLLPGMGSLALNNGDSLDTTDAQNAPIVGVRNRGAAEDCIPQYSSIIVNECWSYTLPSGNMVANQSGIYQDTLTTICGADSVITIHLFINTSYSNLAIMGCDSFVSPSGYYVWYNSGVYIDTVLNSMNCDSIITINLTIENATSSSISEVVCNSYSSPSGNYIWENSGLYRDTIINNAGCDSVIWVNLTVNSSRVTIYDTVCGSFTSPSGNYLWISSGVFMDTISNYLGCDSIITVDLIVNQIYQVSDTIVACDSLTWIDGITYYSNNTTAIDTLLSVSGCDSIVSLDLTIINSTTFTDTITACDSLTWINGITYHSSNNTAKDTLMNSVGCDSVVTLDLTITQSSSFVQYLADCDSLTWINGVTYYQDTIVTYTITNGVGCDSVITLNLDLQHSTMAIDSIIAVNQYTWIDGITYYAHNSTATHVITNGNGCDSLVTLYLEIQVVQIGVDQEGSTLSATADSGTFQWVECPNYDIIPGATDTVFTPTQNGSYAVIVTQNGYSDTSDCIAVNNVGIGEVSLSNNINIYPNPVHDQVNIEITNWPTNGVEIVVRDIAGKQVYTKEVEPISNKETIPINTSKWAKGTYFIELSDGENQVVEKIVVQ